MKRRNPIVLALVFSLVCHLLLLALGAFFPVLIPSEEPLAKLQKEKVVEVTLVPKGMQIADISPPAKEEIPDKARYVGMYDSNVPQEQVAPSRRTGGGLPEETVPTSNKGNHPRKKQVSAEKGERKVGIKSPEESKPSVEKKVLGGDGDYFNGFSEDFFPDYKMGDHTYLNVLKFPKIGYFVRLKKIFRTTFDPDVALRTSFTQVSRGQIDVVLAVSVDRMGKLAELQIVRSSGLQAYDREAVRTVRDSAPFAVPPHELLDQDSLLRMAWTFTVYL